MTLQCEILLSCVRAWFFHYGAERWARRHAAETKDGAGVEPLDERAYGFSVTGALDRTLAEFGWRATIAAPSALARVYVHEACWLLMAGVCSRDDALYRVDDRARRCANADELVAWIDAALERGRRLRNGGENESREEVFARVAAGLAIACGRGAAR